MEREVYPKHLYEQIRREIGVDYVRHELRKYLPSIKGEVWRRIDQDIEGWFDEAPFLYPVRDFWNGVHGIMMGFKLYSHLLNFITGENVRWTKEEIELELLNFGTVNSLVKEMVPEGNEVRLAMSGYLKNERLRKSHLEEMQKWYEITEERSTNPIIATQKSIEGKDKLVVYDGNGRTTLAVLKGRGKILAYVGRFVDERRQPENYWLPTSLLMEIVHFVKKAKEMGDDNLYDSYVRVLRDMLDRSDSGRYEMLNRVVSKGSKFYDEFMVDLDLSRKV
ncbi:hypothetical protein [Candidatus Chazhemtobacterium aquaticus]|uniref:Uncharacterized protein n=1 Tax=Candidatus Chazhemtobacterium aquaticus TaxID=2715735 RepID=A0A857ND57_9BACT|nr:hypothetical protein [Candidatus Chazhemtobacterium aquaticus]QHO63401.1 hypothetical protein MICH65_0420 [Candidatus Chazhemtobacterium aquaticus]